MAKPMRLKGYDYSKSGLYFITICCQNMIHRFGKIENKIMNLNDAGMMVSDQWLALKNRFQNIELHEFVVMPNHFHGIIQILPNTARTTLVVAPDNQDQPQGIDPSHHSKTIGDMMDAFKSITTVEYIRGVKNLGWPRFDGKLWQRNYWERIIRDHASLGRIETYIINNPAKWKHDTMNS